MTAGWAGYRRHAIPRWRVARRLARTARITPLSANKTRTSAPAKRTTRLRARCCASQFQRCPDGASSVPLTVGRPRICSEICLSRRSIRVGFLYRYRVESPVRRMPSRMASGGNSRPNRIRDTRGDSVVFRRESGAGVETTSVAERPAPLSESQKQTRYRPRTIRPLYRTFHHRTPLLKKVKREFPKLRICDEIYPYRDINATMTPRRASGTTCRRRGNPTTPVRHAPCARFRYVFGAESRGALRAADADSAPMA